MTTSRVSVTGPASPETAWQRYVHPGLWRTWSPQIRFVEYDHPVLVPGTRGTVRTFGGIGIPFAIEEVAAAERTWTWRVRVGGLSLRLHHGVLPHAQGSETWLAVSGPPVISPAYARIATIALRRLLRRE
ncbi:SRPBCC family protein [Janibacter sp. GS2]|uniref:SRPBCC family protein n=1 Tax=Janibacter sp. GS2 TaxID=3442646 RepID=UPI003EBAEF56